MIRVSMVISCVVERRNLVFRSCEAKGRRGEKEKDFYGCVLAFGCCLLNPFAF
jgi:hypothetical protein